MVVVRVQALAKHFVRPRAEPGIEGALRGIIRRQVDTVEALKGVSFDISAGEFVGLVGPNGAGKTTTLKVLAGVLVPSLGVVDVLGHVPWRREVPFLRRITLVLGQSGFLEEVSLDLSVLDGLKLMGDLYGVRGAAFRRTADELVEVLGLGELLATRLRHLSKGQRMRAELVASLLWRPELLLLDEPTLGLDLTSRSSFCEFLKRYVRDRGATAIMSSHYMGDIQKVATRLIALHSGAVAYDGSLDTALLRYSSYKTVTLAVDAAARLPVPTLTDLPGVAAAESFDGKVVLTVAADQLKPLMSAILAAGLTSDFSVGEIGLEEVARDLFSKEALN